MPNDDLLKYLRSFAPQSTTTRTTDAISRALRPGPSIGPAKAGNIPLPRGSAQDLNPQSPINFGKLANVATLGYGPMLVKNAKRGYDAAKQLHDGNTKGALADAAGTAGDMAMMHPAVQGLVGKLGSKLAGRISDQMLDVGSLPERYAVLTGENPGGSAIDAATNSANNAVMRKRFEDAGYRVSQGRGAYQDGTTGEVLHENPFIVHDVPERFAKLVAKEHGQNGVITQRGYHDLTSGQLFPSSGNEATSGLPFTELPNGQRFAANIDWNNPTSSGVNALPVPKGHNAEVKRITQQMVGAAGGTSLPRVNAVDPVAAKHMASVYDALPKFDPAAKDSYDALNSEVAKQYQSLQDQGYKFEFTNSDPYKSSKDMAADVAQNRTLKVLATPEDNFHPYMTPDQNNKFRAVHDLLAHAGEGHQFGPKGEENAYRVHMSTLSPTAQQALATETRGQNSWVNYGPNASLPAAQRPFAEQKAALWPKDLLGDYDSMQPKPVAPTAPAEPSEAAKNYVPNFGRAAGHMIDLQQKLEAADPIAPPSTTGNGLMPNPSKVAADSASSAMVRNMMESGFAGGVPNTGVVLPTSGAGRSGSTTTAMAAARQAMSAPELRKAIQAEVARRGGATSPEVSMAASEQVARNIASAPKQPNLYDVGTDPQNFVRDTHEAKGGTLAAPYHGYFADQGGFSNPEYGRVEQNYRGVANDMGISDRTAQEARWRGGGNITGLRSPANQDYAQIAENLILKHSQLTNQSPQDAMRNIATGNQALFVPKANPSLFDY